MSQAIILWLIFTALAVECTISPGDKVKPNKGIKMKKGPQDENVFDKDLIEDEPLAKDILTYNAAYYKETSLRNFNGTVLGYVTAWNSHGYDIAKMFAKKFDIISPVWLQIVKHDDNYGLAGTHDMDVGWMRDLRRKGKRNSGTLKILPRVIFESFTQRDMSTLLGSDKERNKVLNLIVSACKESGFDGIVFEFWSQLAGRVDDKFLLNFAIEMAKALHKHDLRFVLVIPPFRKDFRNMFDEKHMDRLYTYVDAFSLMTYDFSTVQRPGANAPLYWIKRSIEHIAPDNCHDVQIKRQKVLMGLNLYGNDYTPDGGGPIIGNQYLQLLTNVKKRLSYDERDVENYFEIKTNTGRHIVFYPSLYSIHERIKLAQEMGVGLSLWELGQGLDYFYDLF